MIEIKKLTQMLYPLKSLRNSINSVVFSNSNGELAVNTKAQDGSQFINIKWKNELASIPENMPKFGIYNLNEFITTLELFGGENVTGRMEDNKLALRYKSNEKVEIKYNLSDISLIDEASEGPKEKIKFLTTFKIDKEFLKKIKDISSSLNIKILKIEAKDKVVSYTISSKDFHSHVVKENLYNADIKNFEVYLNIEKLNIIPENRPLIISLNEQIVEFSIEDPTYNVLRYFIAPITLD